MEIKELNNDGLTIRLAFHFVAEDYAEGRKKILNRIRRNADIKGFGPQLICRANKGIAQRQSTWR